MTPDELKRDALEAMASGTRMILVRRGGKPPRGFPRGELISEEHDGRRVFSYEPEKVLAWLKANRLA